MVRPIAFGTVTRDALPDQIAARLIALITEHQLKAGDRLPPERELAATMGVSRSSLREALRALAMLGVAEMRQGDGTYLTNLQPGSLMRSVGLVLALERLRAGGALRGAQAGRAGAGQAGRRADLARRRDRAGALRRRHARRAGGPRGVHVGRHRAAREDRPGGLQRRARAPAGVDRGHGHRQPPPHRPAGARCASRARTTTWTSRPRSRPTTATRPSRRCCATWRTSNGR